MHRPAPLNRCLAASFASCLTLLPASAPALTLGNLVVHSHLGQPLRAHILAKTGPDEIIDESCVALSRPSTVPEQFPYLSNARLSVESTATGQLIRIRSTQSVSEPVLKLLLQVTCGGQTALSREFTVLLDPQDYAKAAPLPQEELPTVTTSESPSTPKPGSTWEIRPGDRLDSLSHMMFPSSHSKQKRIEQAIIEANPQLFKDGVRQELPTGQVLNIPELAMPQQAAPATTTHRNPRKPPRRAMPAEIFQLKLTTGEIDLSTSRNITEEDRLRLREKQLLLEADDQVANILSLKERVKQLETQLNALSLKMSGGVSEAAPKAAQPAPEPAAAPAGKQRGQNHMQFFWFGLAGLAAALGVYLGIRLHRQKRESAETLQSFQLNMPADDISADQPAPQRHAARPVEAAASRPAKAHVEEHDYDPHSIFGSPEEKITLTEVDSVIEEADLYLIYGWTQKATDLLQGYIEKHPLELQPWMMLFDIYHSQSMKDAFDKLAPRFREKFDNPEAWKKVQALGHAISPKNPLYCQESQQPVADDVAPEDGVTKGEASQEMDYWSQATVDFRPNHANQVKPGLAPEDSKDTPLPRIKDI